MIQPVSDADLVQRALAVREYAYAPYSGYQVGAAVLTADGRVFSGCNIENSSYGLTVCAERVALLKAVSEGFRKFTTLAVVGPGDDYCLPCGACLQVMAEFAPSLRILTADSTGRFRSRTLPELLPEAFTLIPSP